MISKIQKWGNSLAIRIPKLMANEMKVEDGALVQMTMREQALIIEPCSEDKEWALSGLLAQVTDDNRHEEWEKGGPVGREIW
jgi:antitoxin MazE